MSNITVCARFRPLSSKERREYGECLCFEEINSETFYFKDEKEEDSIFSYDRVFYDESEQAAVYEFLAFPIIRDAVSAINGTIITYGQTGAGKTYSMEGPSIQESSEQKKGLLPRIVDGMFEHINSIKDETIYTIKLSMVEIYMEKVRDLFDLTNDNIQIKESKTQGILLRGVTEIPLSGPDEALQKLSSGISNRAVGETQMNMSSSRSHCVYIFTVQQESVKDKRVRAGKLVLVDLAGSEKIEKTGAEGRVLDEAKTINKSLSALGNVINALTCGTQSKTNHIPYRDSKLTRILQDALGGNSRTALLCCCSPSPSNASETLSTLRFGMRAKHIKSSPCVRDFISPKSSTEASTEKDASCERILEKIGERFTAEDVKLLEELLKLEGIFFNPDSIEEVEAAYQDLVSRTVSLLQQIVEHLHLMVTQLRTTHKVLRVKASASEKLAAARPSILNQIPEFIRSFGFRFASFSPEAKLPK